MRTQDLQNSLVKVGQGSLRSWSQRQSGKVGWAILWLLGVPLPVLLVLYLIRGH